MPGLWDRNWIQDLFVNLSVLVAHPLRRLKIRLGVGDQRAPVMVSLPPCLSPKKWQEVGFGAHERETLQIPTARHIGLDPLALEGKSHSETDLGYKGQSTF